MDEKKRVIEFLIADEEEAIDGYNKAIKKLKDIVDDKIIEELKNIKLQEQEHIEKLNKMLGDE